ncbi:MAG: response regulator [Bacteroidetes bacterium]|nr:response regulator [Bacteroidota bacterium]
MGEQPGLLIVEDEDYLRLLLVEILSEHGYTVFEAEDGEEAVETYRQHQNEIDIVLSDLGLPHLGGWEAFEKMREINSNVKGILASGYFDPQLKERILATGAKYFIQKPYNPPDIIALLDRIVKGEE